MLRRFVNIRFLYLQKQTSSRKIFKVENLQSVTRSYCQLTRSCWNCQAVNEKTEIFCNSCNSIQKIHPKIDYFDLFGIQKEPRINIKELTKRFRSVQSQIHPDKFSTKTKEEQTLSSEWSSLVNKAYRTLQSPLKRGEYLLSLRGIQLNEEAKTDDNEFLIEMMERNETVEEAETKDELLSILNELQDKIADLGNKFASSYQSKNYAAAKNYLIKMKYFLSIENITKEKILRL
ncbi:hypothetical protein PVAND_003442 [Polypedilum vanderplanki]|uniref:J domain-containing protein n=1 Tax=Polypedilum vanderplanki TaxID=319348 RepID=A0A9J6BV40_POLVA|nr:hypothetical protein PVAND_003442 [Polypedilum vanderplanki]